MVYTLVLLAVLQLSLLQRTIIRGVVERIRGNVGIIGCGAHTTSCLEPLWYIDGCRGLLAVLWGEEKYECFGRTICGHLKRRDLAELQHTFQIDSVFANKHIALHSRLKLFDAAISPAILFSLANLQVQQGSGESFRRRFQETLVQSQVRFNKVLEKVPEKVLEIVWQALVHSQISFNRVPEKVPEKVPGTLGANPSRVPRVPWEVLDNPMDYATQFFIWPHLFHFSERNFVRSFFKIIPYRSTIQS